MTGVHLDGPFKLFLGKGERHLFLPSLLATAAAPVGTDISQKPRLPGVTEEIQERVCPSLLVPIYNVQIHVCRIYLMR